MLIGLLVQSSPQLLALLGSFARPLGKLVSSVVVVVLDILKSLLPNSHLFRILSGSGLLRQVATSPLPSMKCSLIALPPRQLILVTLLLLLPTLKILVAMKLIVSLLLLSLCKIPSLQRHPLLFKGPTPSMLPPHRSSLAYIQ